MNDIVWATKEDMSSFENVISRMRNFALEMTEAAGINLEFNAVGQAEQFILSMQQRKNTYMFFKEAVNNAIKHSGASNIILDITINAKILDVTIKDNGWGFAYESGAPNSRAAGGSGLDGMKFRAEQINAMLKIATSPGNCTVLGMQVSVK